MTLRGGGEGSKTQRHDAKKSLEVSPYTLVKYATLQHIEPCGVTTYQYSKVSFLKLQCRLHGRVKTMHHIQQSDIVFLPCIQTYYNCFVEVGSVMIINSSALFSSVKYTTV